MFWFKLDANRQTDRQTETNPLGLVRSKMLPCFSPSRGGTFKKGIHTIKFATAGKNSN